MNEWYYSAYKIKLDGIDISNPYYRYNSYMAVKYNPTFHAPFQLLGINFSASPSLTVALNTEDDFFSGEAKIYPIVGIDFRAKNESLIFPTVGMKMRYNPTYESSSERFSITLYSKDLNLIEALFSPKPIINSP